MLFFSHKLQCDSVATVCVIWPENYGTADAHGNFSPLTYICTIVVFTGTPPHKHTHPHLQTFATEGMRAFFFLCEPSKHVTNTNRL